MSAADGEPTVTSAEDLFGQQAETRSLDYKAATTFGPTKREKGEFVKDLMAFSNTQDGGYILVGVAQTGGRFIVDAMSDEQMASFDPTIIGTFARNYCSMMPVFQVTPDGIDGKRVLLVAVGPFVDQPIVCTKDLHSDGDHILRAGAIYVRTADARSVPVEGAEDMARLLDVAVSRRGDALLGQIRRLVGGTAIGEVPSSSPFDAQLSGGEDFLNRRVPEEPWWEVTVRPVSFDPVLVPSVGELRDIRARAEVSIRGWNFPHVDRENDRNFEDGIESWTTWELHFEAHRFYKSGLFVWRQRLWEETDDTYRGSLSYLSAIGSITEFLLFAARLATNLPSVEECDVEVLLRGLEGRRLKERRDIIWSDHVSGAQEFRRSARLPVAELRASHLELAVRWSRDLFELFNFDVAESVLADWQQKFIERRF